jgi:hypothetical protein
VAAPIRFTCATCGERHDELPLALHAAAPSTWSPQWVNDPESELGAEQCVIHGENFFVRGLVRIPIVDAAADFEWGVWVT